MHTSLVLTIIGPDRTGLVESVARVVAQHEGNWHESHMARLAGKFAGVLRVDVPTAEAGALSDSLRDLEAEGLTVVIERADGGQLPTDCKPMHLELVGPDRPGIVRDVSHALAQRHVNVVELATSSFSAPMSGETLFKAEAQLSAPQGEPMDDLRVALEEVAGELGLDMSLDEAVE